MRIQAFVLGLAAPLFVLSSCGGRTADLPDSGIGEEAEAGTDAEAPDVAPDVAVRCPFPAQVSSGAACTQAGLDCPSNVLAYDCTGQPTVPVTCSCGLGVWNCAHVTPPCPPPPPPCPAPATIQAGGLCAVAAGVSCQSAAPIVDCEGAVLFYVSCQCSRGQWVCKQPNPVSCVDASPPPATCPNPAKLGDGVACSAAGLQCKGNPTFCDGATFYDALQCDGSKFMTVAQTLCGYDAATDAGKD